MYKYTRRAFMGKKVFKKTCKECGNTFDARNVKKIYCTGACKSRAWRKRNIKDYRHKCLECERDFISNEKYTKFCSFSCAGKHKNKIGIGKEGFCRNCETKFSKKHSKHYFCSNKCKGAYGHTHAKKETIKCSYCEKSFERSVWQHRGENSFCSKKCESKFVIKKNEDSRICKECGKTFLCKKSDKLILCSMKCQGKWQSENRRGKNSPNYKHSYPESKRNRRCKQCKKVIRAKPYQDKTKKYCSKKCLLKSQSNTMTLPHRITVDILRKNRIWYRTEYPSGKYLLDCYLGKGLSIEIQGGYWHGDVRLYPEPINKIQEKADKKDKKKKLFLERNGITVLYIWEKDIEEFPEMCEKLILRFVERNGKLLNYHSMNYKIDRGKLVLNRERIVPRFEK